MALCPGLPRWDNLVLLKQETVSGSGISWTICKPAPRSRQISMAAPHHSVFYRPDALPAAQPTASKHRRQRRQGVRIRKNKQVCVDPCTLARNMTLPTATLGHLQLASTRRRQLSISAACAQAVASSK